jgi:hypothetical protein
MSRRGSSGAYEGRNSMPGTAPSTGKVKSRHRGENAPASRFPGAEIRTSRMYSGGKVKAEDGGTDEERCLS